jgi:hypothetical protein
LANPCDLDDRLSFLGIDANARAALTNFAPVLRTQMPAVMAAFADHLRTRPALNSMFTGPVALDRALDALATHWTNLFSGRFDDGYIASVRRIGLTHSRIGLDPRWFFGGYAGVLSHLGAIAATAHFSRFRPAAARDRTILVQRALTQAAILDMDLTISIFLEENRHAYETRLGALAAGFEASVKGVGDAIAAAAEAARTGVPRA